MSYIASGGATGAITAAAARKRLQEEEEQMTAYNKDDLDGWEFKIVRSDTGRFRNSRFIQEICQQEARAGWEMLEKFDNSRVRFKRRIERRGTDSHLEIDPYRTSVGLSGRPLMIVIAAIAFAVAMIAALLGAISK
jgi:hypothetical protein